jgi:membrane protease YdiL (CAAX protease family)
VTRTSAWPALLAYLAAFVVSLFASAIVVVVPVWRYRSAGAARLADEVARFATSAPGLIAVAATNAAVLLAVAALFIRLSGRPLASSFRLGPSRLRARSLAAAPAGMMGLSFACASAVDLARVRNGSVMQVLAESLRALRPGLFVIALLGLAIAPGVAEEAFFRGFFQTRVATAWGRRAALFVSAAAFAIMHIDPAQAAVAFAAGVYLGWLADRGGSIRPAILAHALNNGVFVVLAAFGTDATDATVARTTSVRVLCAGAVVFASAMAVIVREAPSSAAQ